MTRLIFLIVYLLIGVFICGLAEYNETSPTQSGGVYLLVFILWPIPVIAAISIFVIAFVYKFGKKVGCKITDRSRRRKRYNDGL